MKKKATGQKTYLHVTPTNGLHESRLFREAETARQTGEFDRILVIAKRGRHDGPLPLANKKGRSNSGAAVPGPQFQG